ncbi:MAG: tetratricopeptide repeat protein [Elusimicrobia bacterium]|nr:tetratricopeptide repeat protein [Elusimicrobiota bacterium]
MDPFKRVEALGLYGKIEDLSERFGLPHAPEYELSYFRTLYRPELRAALDAAETVPAKRRNAVFHARRGRLRRAAGDQGGALADYQAALDLDPERADAHAGLGEADLSRPEAEESLSRALVLEPDHAWARLDRGAARLLADRAAEAREDLERFVGLAPESALGFLLLGMAEERLGRRERAAKAYERAWEKDRVCSAACLLRARAAKSFKDRLVWFHRAYDVSPVLGFITLQIHQTVKIDAPAYVDKILRFCFERPEQVAAYYRREATQSHFSHFPAEDYDFVRRLCGAHPDLGWANAFFGRASCYTPAGMPEGIAHLTRAIRQVPHAGWLRAWRANAKRAVGDAAGALKDFGDAARLQPFYHRSFVWRGGLLRKLGRFPEALADLDRALAMDPHYSLTYWERSLARRGQGDVVGAAFDLDRAYLLDHRYHWAFKTGGAPAPEELKKGISQLTAAIARFPSMPSLRVWRGQLRLQQWDRSAAVLDFERAAEIDPHHALAHGWAARALLESGRPAAAAERARRAISLEPRFAMARMWLAESLRALGQTKEAKAVLAEALRLKKTTPWAHYLLGVFAYDDRNFAAAEKELNTALLLDGKYPEAYLLLAQVLLARGKAKPALAAAQRCVDVAGNLGRAYVIRAAANLNLGNAKAAVADYEKVLKEFPYLLNPQQKADVENLLAVKH